MLMLILALRLHLSFTIYFGKGNSSFFISSSRIKMERKEILFEVTNVSHIMVSV